MGLIYWGNRFKSMRRTTIILYGIVGGAVLVAAGLVVNHSAGLPIAVLAGRRRSSPLPACSCWPARRRPRSACWPTSRSASRPTAGAIMGLYSVFLAIGQIIGSLIGGFAADWRGIDGMLVATARAARASRSSRSSRLRRAGARDRRPDVPARIGEARLNATCDTCPILGGRWRAALTRRRHRSRPPIDSRRPVTSNVSQNYPYTSETEASAPTSVAALVAAARISAAKLAAETTPLDDNERWWVWKCPTPGCPGLLHVAGYAPRSTRVYVVCDGTCGKTFLR